MKRFVFIALLLAVFPAYAQKTKATLNTEIGVQFPDNTTGAIAPSNLRTVTADIVNSIMPTSPVVSGNLACFNGTTGLLQDCGVAPSSIHLTVGSTVISGGVNTRVLYDNNGILGELGSSGSGSVCLTISCAMTTPNLGVATATSLNGLSIVSQNSQANIGLGTALSSATPTGNNIVISKANGLTTGDQNVVIGNGGTGGSLTTDTSNTYIGYDVAPGGHNGAVNSNNTGVGALAFLNCTTCGSSTAVGRGALGGEVAGDHNTGVGHATSFFGSGNVQTTVIGDSAGGGALAGTAIPSGFPNVGTSVFGLNGDSNIECIGETCGKATSAVRKQSFAIGSYSRIPARDNVGVLGNGLQAVETAGRMWDGTTAVTLSANSGQTWTCAQTLTGILIRTGSLGGGFNDQPPTAAAIVQCATGGVGDNSEVPLSVPFWYVNTGTGQTATIVTNTGITLGGLSATVANNTSSQWRVIITSATPSSEAVTLFRVQ